VSAQTSAGSLNHGLVALQPNDVLREQDLVVFDHEDELQSSLLLVSDPTRGIGDHVLEILDHHDLVDESCGVIGDLLDVIEDHVDVIEDHVHVIEVHVHVIEDHIDGIGDLLDGSGDPAGMVGDRARVALHPDDGEWLVTTRLACTPF
jgi:hypothetical protein